MRVIFNNSKPKNHLQQTPIQRQPSSWWSPIVKKSSYPTAHQLKAQARKKLMAPHINDNKPEQPMSSRLPYRELMQHKNDELIRQKQNKN